MPSIPQSPDASPPGAFSESGLAIRDLSVRVLRRRYEELLARSKRRHLTGAERTELERLGVVIDTLQGMG